VSPATFMLCRGDTLQLQAPSGARLRVRSGDIWLTQHNDGKDHILQSDQTLLLNGEGEAVITACRTSVLEIEGREPAAATGTRNGRARRAGGALLRGCFGRLAFRFG